MVSAMRTAIIGGGIAGLAAAYELEQARQKGAQVEYTLFEARARLAGCLASRQIANELINERICNGESALRLNRLRKKA
jgi:oxygen-dependent protoporphyrinogen oxidase